MPYEAFILGLQCSEILARVLPMWLFDSRGGITEFEVDRMACNMTRLVATPPKTIEALSLIAI
jgi:hypothetical protein